MLKREYDPYNELAKEIVAQIAEDYIKSSRYIVKCGHKSDLSKNQYNRLVIAIKHRAEDIIFFESERPFILCGVDGKFILRTLNKRLINNG